MFVSQPEFFDRVLEQTIRNVTLISEGVLDQTTGKEHSTPRDTELRGVDYVNWYNDLAGRGILLIVQNLDELYGTNWVERWSRQYDREVERLRLV